MRDAATNEQLQKKVDANAKVNPLAQMKVKDLKDLPDPTKVKPKDLLATSDFLSARGFSTLVPKRAILHIPKKLQSRIKFEEGSKLVIWPQFYRGNRGWIKTMEVTHAQARGEEPFDEKVVENMRESTVVIVATYKGGPISVLPYKDPEEEAQKEKEKLKQEGAQNAAANEDK